MGDGGVPNLPLPAPGTARFDVDKQDSSHSTRHSNKTGNETDSTMSSFRQGKLHLTGAALEQRVRLQHRARLRRPFECSRVECALRGHIGAED